MAKVNIINKLKNFDVNSLKNIDINELKDKFRSKPEYLICATIIFVTLFGSIQLLTIKSKKAKKFSSQIKKLEEKVEMAENLKVKSEEFENFVDDFPRSISDDDLRYKIDEFALANNVHIRSFDPTEEKETDLFELTTVKVNIASTDYTDLINFIQAIEKAPYNIRVEKLSREYKSNNTNSRTRSRFGSNRNKDADSATAPIEIQVEIGTIKIK